jgi:hypothetical protein
LGIGCPNGHKKSAHANTAFGRIVGDALEESKAKESFTLVRPGWRNFVMERKFIRRAYQPVC